MKTCTKCGEHKPLTDYYVKREHGRERLASHCKDCHRIVSNQWLQKNRDRARQRRRSYDAAAAEKIRQQARARRAASPEKQEAYNILRAALLKAEITKPDRCNRCHAPEEHGSDGRSLLHAHHHDYSAPLDVEWLCASCHQREHALEKVS